MDLVVSIHIVVIVTCRLRDLNLAGESLNNHVSTHDHELPSFPITRSTSWL
jgi:hypothetical protein